MNEELGPGAVVAGRYRLDRLLGRGGMGQVWAVTHSVTHRAAALKLLHGPLHLQADRRRRFLREARAASAVNHPNVVRVHDFFELEDGTPVMLMDLLEGETLRQRLARERSLPLPDVVEVILPVVSAVGTAHSRGIIHRDLKPDNVFLARSDAGRLEVRVLDFGVAKLTLAGAQAAEDSDALTHAGSVLGTPSYMSPEQAFGEGTVDHRTDIWSIGVVLYEALSGARPVDGANVGQVLKRLMNEAITPIEVLVPELPADVASLIGRMLKRDPESRPSDLREVNEVLAKHGKVEVPAFDAAVGEAPPPLDSSPTSGQRSSRVVVRVAPDSDESAATHAAETQADATSPSFGVESAPAAPAPAKGNRRAWAVGALALALGAGAAWLAGATDDGRGPPAPAARSQPPPGNVPPARPAPAAAPEPVTPDVPRAAVPPAVEEPARAAARRRAAPTRVQPSAAPAPPPAAAPSAPPKAGLVEEPPF